MNGPVLVTGAAGFVAGHLIERLAAAKVPIEAWTHRPPAASGLRLDGAAVTWRAVDVLDRGAVFDALDALRPRAIFHLAGATHVARSWHSSAAVLRTNVIGTDHVLEGDRVQGCRARILVPGSATVYAHSNDPLTEQAQVHPGSPYAVSKLAQEQLALAAAARGQAVYVTRSFNHIGPRQSPDFAAASFARQIAEIERGLRGPVLRVGNLSARRDVTDVRDTVAAYVAIVERGRPGVLYNVCSSRAASMGEILDGLRRRASAAIDVTVDPALVRPHDAPVLVGSFSRLAAETGWHPAFPLDRTLDDLLEYWRATVTLTPHGSPQAR